MKQKFLCAFMAIAMSVSPSICQAERPRPTNPAVALTPGQTYYLYNVEADLFLSHVAGSSSYTGISSAPRPVEVNALENSAYTLWLTDGGDKGAIYSDNKTYAYTTGQKSARASNKTYWWAIASTGSKKYTIQRSSLNTNYYNANEYLGWVGETSVYVYANRPADGNIHWQFIPANVNGDRFVASLLLYHALEKADAYADRGWNFSYYENLYANRQTAAPEEMTNAAKALEHGLPMSQGYIAPYWNEYPILWATNDGSFGQGYDYTWDYYNYSSPGYFYTKFGASTGSRTLSATVSIDEPSTFVYSTSGTNNMNSKIQVYVDDKLVRTLTGPQINTYTSASICARFFEVLQPGTHTIKWVASTTNSDAVYFYIKSTGVVKSPLITVSLLEPGSLGTEVLYNTDHIKNVRRLKVSGKMNDDDWAKVKMMSGLLDLDLSEAEFTEVPEGQFRVGEGNDTVMQFLHRLVLPEGVTKINKQAFFYSFIDTLALPSTLKNIRQDAFDCSHIQEINMPDDCTEIYGTETGSEASYAVFNGMKWLRKLKCAKNWTIIPKYTFNNCTFLEDVTLPEKLEAIGNCAFSSDKYLKISNFPEGLKRINQHAFDGCSSAEFGPFPESLQTIDIYAFVGCNKIVDLVIPPNVSSIGVYTFADCTNMKTAELGVGQYAIANNLFSNCNQLKTLRLNSPTVVTVTDNSGYYPVASDRLKEVDLIVPSFLVNAYKLHKYWYNFKSITGFSTAEIQDWIINNPLVMNHDRFEGNPNITIAGSSRLPSLKFNGTNAQNINNLVLESYHENYNNKPGQIFSNGSNIHVNGNVEVQLYTAAKRWYFFSIPVYISASAIRKRMVLSPTSA